MTTRTNLVAAVLLIATVFGTFACAQQQTKASPPMSSPANAASMEMHKAMMQGQSMSMPMTGDVDKDFATMMTMHHRQAIAMIDVYLQHGDDAELRALAQHMKQAQQKEIIEMAPHKK